MRLPMALSILAVTAALLGQTMVPADAELAAAADGSVHFTTAGDYSTTSNTFSVLNAIGASDPDLHLALGDLSYSTTLAEEAWCDMVTSRVGVGFPFELISGNHESNGDNGSINNFSACLPNQLPGAVGTYGRQYYVDVPAVNPLVRYVMISPGLLFPDGTWSYAVGSPRYNWTSAAIDGARSAGIPWVVVGMHKPCLSMGVYTCDPGADLQNLLISKRVDVVLHGHEHMYQRTHQLANGGGCPAVTPGTFSAACIADSDATMVKGAGTVFATVGTGGVALRDVNAADSEAGYFAKSEGLNANPTWGFLDFVATPTTLSASFVRAAGGTFTDTFSITAGSQVNAPPTAAFTSTCTLLSCSFDGGSSSDTDGTVAGYAWSFGDGATGTGATASHAFAAAGTYTVTLTVTDDDGAVGTLSQAVTVTGPQPTTIAQDDFQRTVASGWGTAPTGGAWTVTGGTGLQVTGGTGRISLTAGATRVASLNAVSATSTDITVDFALDKVPTGGGTYIGVIPRQVGTANYLAQAWVKSTGAASVVVQQGTTGLANVTLNGFTYTAGTVMKFRVQAVGTSPTVIRTKVWPASQQQPTAWNTTNNDSTAALQSAGSIALRAYQSSSATSTLVAQFDNLVVQPGQ